MSEDSETTATPEPAQRVSSYFFLIIFIVLIISFAALYIAITSFAQSNPDLTEAAIFLVIGFVGVSFSTYMLLQTRHRVMQLSLEIPPVLTTITCQKCDFKNQREFERGDYVFKEAGPCPKCNNKLIISAIYREVKEKPKKEIF
jgi:hypothetical protein